MNNIAVIGLNNYGMEIARVLSLSGSSVIVIDTDQNKIEKIASEVAETLLIQNWETAKLKSLKFDCYDAILLMMSENMVLVLASMIYLQLFSVKNIIICTENDEQEELANLFRVNQGWRAIRFDKQVAANVKSLIDCF